MRLDSGGSSNGTIERPFLERKLKSLLPRAKALLVSYYGYGWIKPDLVSNTTAGRIPSTIDSRFGLTEFGGMTAATPNEPEVESALGIRIGNDTDKLEWAGRTLLRRLKHKALLITRGKDGMALERSKKPGSFPFTDPTKSRM